MSRKFVYRPLILLVSILILGSAAYFHQSGYRSASEAHAALENWPPRLGSVWPPIPLIDQDGHEFTVDTFRGKVVIIEPIGMNCPACQAFSGGNKVGGLEGITLQGGTKSFEEYFSEYTSGLSLDDSRFVFIQLLFYDMRMGATKPADAKLWALHFGGTRKPNRIVAVPKNDLRGEGSYNLIPGFQLLDKKLVLRFDATGHRPRHGIWSELLPAVRPILSEDS